MNEELNNLKKLWEFLKPKEGNPCVYCGLLASEKEHVTPKSYIEGMKELKTLGFDVKIPEEILVPACRECNLIASDKLFKSFADKKRFISERLFKKYHKFLKISSLSEEEILELSGRLQQQVFIFNEIAKIIKVRMQRIKKGLRK